MSVNIKIKEEPLNSFESLIKENILGVLLLFSFNPGFVFCNLCEVILEICLQLK